jgi:hypothetical protein
MSGKCRRRGSSAGVRLGGSGTYAQGQRGATGHIITTENPQLIVVAQRGALFTVEATQPRGWVTVDLLTQLL